MNYRHAFHAGNFADVLKHVLLARMLVYLVRKPAPLRYIDIHAGIGRYDLAGSEAARTGEWRQGIGRVLAEHPPEAVGSLLAPYLDAVGPRGEDGRPLLYPGSPAIAQAILRPEDRLLLCELHPDDVAALRAGMRRDRRVTILASDGYQALKAAVPPPERRGLVLLDPPFEDRAEWDHMTAAFVEAYRRWPTGTYALWYPIKDGAPTALFLRGLRELGLPKTLEVEVFGDTLAERLTGLRGSGLFIVNPPYTLAAEARTLLPYLAACFGAAGAAWRWRADEVEA